jgi:phenylacetate-CoA ligase
MKKLLSLNLDNLQEKQLQGLQWSVKHAYNGSETYRNKLDELNLKPDVVQSMDDLKRLPFTSPKDLTDGYPFPLLSVPIENVSRIHTSSGTTGKRKVLCYTKKDIQDWVQFFTRCFEFAGLNAEDRVQIAVGYGPWTAGISFQTACEAFGAMAIPAGPGDSETQTEFLIDFQSTVLCCTASMGLLMSEEVQRKGIRDQINLKKIIYGSERSSDLMRARIKSNLGITEMYDITGMTELYGPGTGIECSYNNGIHYWSDYYLLEIIDPETLEVLAPGETGEMVVTTLKKEAVPLIRYRTHDRSALIAEPCPCGNLFPRHERLQGRTDDMFIFRGVNIYPSQIDTLLGNVSDIGSEYQVLLNKIDGKDNFTLKIERDQYKDSSIDPNITVFIRSLIKNKIFVTPDVEVVEYGSLPRSVRKTKRVTDLREP